MHRAVTLLTILALPAFAFWPAGGVKVVETPDAIENPQMVYIEDGSVVISWEADRQIYCQKLDTTGVIHWDAEGIRVCMSDSTQVGLHMVTDGQDVWFVWQDERADDGDIYAQKIDGSTGQRLWGDQGKELSVKEGRQSRQSCNVLSGGRFIVSWTDYSVDPRDVAVQRFDVGGQALWAPEGIFITRKTGGGNYPAVFPSDEAMVDIWHGIREGETEGAYFAQRIDSDGNFLWDTMGVLIEHAESFYDEDYDNAGGVIVLFLTPVSFKLAVQRVDSLGLILWSPGGVVINESSDNTIGLKNPSPDAEGFVADNAGGCFVWWRDTDLSLCVQHVNQNGSKVWISNGVTYWIRKADEGPLAGTRLSPDGNNGILAVYDNLEWSGEYDPTIDLGVLVQRIDSDGQTVFEDNGVFAMIWNPDSLPWDRFLLTASDVPGGVIAAWGDNRLEPDYSLYAQIVDTTGKVGSGIEEKPQIISAPVLELSSGINTKVLSIKYSIPAGESGILKLFDSSGRLIESHTLTHSEEVMTLDITNFPEGVYFVHLKTLNKTINNKTIILH